MLFIILVGFYGKLGTIFVKVNFWACIFGCRAIGRFHIRNLNDERMIFILCMKCGEKILIGECEVSIAPDATVEMLCGQKLDQLTRLQDCQICTLKDLRIKVSQDEYAGGWLRLLNLVFTKLNAGNCSITPEGRKNNESLRREVKYFEKFFKEQ